MAHDFLRTNFEIRVDLYPKLMLSVYRLFFAKRRKYIGSVKSFFRSGAVARVSTFEISSHN